VLVKGLAQISPDSLGFTYTLRDDVKWDDGSPLTVDDVIFTTKITKCPLSDNGGRRSTYVNLADIVKDPTDPRKFTMRAKNVHYLNKYLFNEMYMLEKKHWDPNGVTDQFSIPATDDPKFDATKYKGLVEYMKDFNSSANGHDIRKMTGLGPYNVSDWVTGSSITLTKKDNYWGSKDTSIYTQAYPDRIIFKFIQDDQSVMLGLKNHSLNVSTFISTANYMKLKEDKKFDEEYYTGMTPQFSYNTIGINMRPDGKNHKKLFDDRKVRWAMAYLTPVEELIKTMTNGTGIRQASYIQPVFKNLYNDTLKLIPFDIEKAKALLAEAGWKDTDGDNIVDKVIDGKKTSLSFKFNFAQTPANSQIVLLLKDAYAKAGVDLQPNPMDLGTLAEAAGKHDFDMMLIALAGGAVPDDPAQIFDSRNWANGDNNTGFGDAETDKLIAKADRELDDAKRAELFKQLQAKIYEQQPFIFMYGVQRKVIVSKKFDAPGMYSERPGVILSALKLKE
jgi:peptide/nickel transport system substrate-binding protein